MTTAIMTQPPDTGQSTRRDALRALYLAHRHELYGFLAKLLRDRHLAEDVLQETFVRAYGALERLDPSRPARPWLFEIARNAALDALRRRRKSEPVEEETAVAPEPELSAKERAERASAALASLPDATRALLLQRHLLGMKLEELAESFSCTERTVRNRLNAAADEFAQALVSGRGRKDQ